MTFRGAPMKHEAKIRRHGYHLMSLASLGMFCIAIITLVMVSLPYQPHVKLESTTWQSLIDLDWNSVWAADAITKAWVSLSNGIWGLSYFLPLLALRQLGSKLHHHEALTLPVAKAFLWLAHALLAYAVLQTLSGFLIGFVDGFRGSALYKPSVSLDFSLTYVWLIGCLCLYSVAHLMQLAAQTADDSRSIV